MAVGGGKPVFEIDLAVVKGEPVATDESDFGWSGQVEYDFMTLLKPTYDNYADYSSRYNTACTTMAKTGDNEGLAEIMNLRYAAHRMAINREHMDLTVSPYTDQGAATCYGYVEGAMELLKQEESRRSFETLVKPVASERT